MAYAGPRTERSSSSTIIFSSGSSSSSSSSSSSTASPQHSLNLNRAHLPFPLIIGPRLHFITEFDFHFSDLDFLIVPSSNPGNVENNPENGNDVSHVTFNVVVVCGCVCVCVVGRGLCAVTDLKKGTEQRVVGWCYIYEGASAFEPVFCFICK